MPGKLLSGETVLITGASRGVGECLAHCFAREGAKLVLCAEEGSKDALKQVADKCKSGASCETHCVDLADSKAVQGFAEKAAGLGITCLINNAGVFVGGEDDTLKGNPDEWDRMMRINAAAPMRLIRALAPAMADKGKGTIICIGDVEAFHTGPTHAAYAASKYALRGFCKSTYEALRDKGIRVMNVAAGNVGATAMAKETGKQGSQGEIAAEDVAEACLLPWHCSANCVPEEIVLKAASPSSA